jgi:hypothetical protein
MRKTWLLILLPVLLGQASPEKKDEPADKLKRDRALEIYRAEADGFEIYRDSSRKEPVVLRHEPVYLWTNPVRNNGQDGAVFVWTCRGRAEVIGTFFSYPATGQRGLFHEFHSLATTVLDVTRPGARAWHPEAPGVEPKPIPDAPAPGPSPTLRLVQMRGMARDFSVHTIDKSQQRWDLRLLPQPLYRYESTDPDVLDGAVFAFVTSAGTDPEMILIVEARRPPGGGDPTWHFAFARFSIQACFARLNGQEVFQAADIPYNSAPSEIDAKFRYTTYRDRFIPPIEGTVP